MLLQSDPAARVNQNATDVQRLPGRGMQPLITRKFHMNPTACALAKSCHMRVEEPVPAADPVSGRLAHRCRTSGYQPEAARQFRWGMV